MAKTVTKTSREYGKPYPTFPLSPHKRGWCKNINGKVKVICGHLPPREAETIYKQKFAQLHGVAEIEQKPEMMIPAPMETPVVIPIKPSMTVEELKEKYIAHKTKQYEVGSYAPRSIMSLREILPKFANAYPGAVVDLTPADFGAYPFSPGQS